MKDINDIKRHEFFKHLNWESVANKKYQPPTEVYPEEEEYFGEMDLDRKAIGLGEYGYEEGGGVMMNHVKNFTFVREELTETAQIRGSILPK